jgi:hypothetical protein
VAWVQVHSGTVATCWPVIPSLDRRWQWALWYCWWNENWQWKPEYSDKSVPLPLCPSHPTRPDLGSNLGLCSRKRQLTAWAVGLTQYKLFVFYMIIGKLALHAHQDGTVHYSHDTIFTIFSLYSLIWMN